MLGAEASYELGLPLVDELTIEFKKALLNTIHMRYYSPSSRFKVELIYAECYKTIKETPAGVFEYIELFYNRQRRHSAIDYISPHEFEQK